MGDNDVKQVALYGETYTFTKLGFQAFISHTKKDEEFCDVIDDAIEKIGFKRFRASFEKIEPPEWKSIRNEMNNSNVLILAVGNELIKNQSLHNKEWHFTQNWIAYEIGLASEREIDIWVICDDVRINFPVPHLTFYLPYSLRRDEVLSNFNWHFTLYQTRQRMPYPLTEDQKIWCIVCPYCHNEYNLYARIPKGQTVICPTCLKELYFDYDFPKNLQ
jgi:hypothetical protein